MMKVRRKNSPLFLETVSNRIEICHDFFQQKQSHSQVFDTRIVLRNISLILLIVWRRVSDGCHERIVALPFTEILSVILGFLVIVLVVIS